MYYLKTKEYKFLVVNWGRDDDMPYRFSTWGWRKLFKRYATVIDATFMGRRVVLEF
jgi:hypothetical protein